MPKFKEGDMIKYEDLEYWVMELDAEGYVLVGRTEAAYVGHLRFDDEPDMHLIETKLVNPGLEKQLGKKKPKQ